MDKRRTRKRRERFLKTPDIGEAFDAAMHLFGEWESPQGAAVVVEVESCNGGVWEITYRVLKEWGKDAWTARRDT